MKFFFLQIFLGLFFAPSVFASSLLVPMDAKQSDHLKAYGLIYSALQQGSQASLWLNYRGGSFLTEDTPAFREMAVRSRVAIEVISDGRIAEEKSKFSQNNQAEVLLESVPKIAVYQPPGAEPWDDAVVMALDYAAIPYETIYDPQIIKGELGNFDWVHLHHEDFTGQSGKFFTFARDKQWYQRRRLFQEQMARDLGFFRVADLKREVAMRIRDYVKNGGFIFAMCSATDSLDIALAANKIDIVSEAIDHTPVTPGFDKLLDYSQTFAFTGFQVYPDPTLYEFSDIDINPRANGIDRKQDFFSLFTFDAETDPIPSLLTQNHERRVRGFLGQTTAFNRDRIKPGVWILADTPGTSRVKYIYGSYGQGFFSFYAGHDPEDYQHLVGDPPTNLSEHRNSPGYRIILNNIFLPAAKQEERKT